MICQMSEVLPTALVDSDWRDWGLRDGFDSEDD